MRDHFSYFLQWSLYRCFNVLISVMENGSEPPDSNPYISSYTCSEPTNFLISPSCMDEALIWNVCASYVSAVILPTAWQYLHHKFDAQPYMLGMLMSAFCLSGLAAGPLMGR